MPSTAFVLSRGRTLRRRRIDIRAYFTHRASNGPTEAINGRLVEVRRRSL